MDTIVIILTRFENWIVLLLTRSYMVMYLCLLKEIDTGSSLVVQIINKLAGTSIAECIWSKLKCVVSGHTSKAQPKWWLNRDSSPGSVVVLSSWVFILLDCGRPYSRVQTDSEKLMKTHFNMSLSLSFSTG